MNVDSKSILADQLYRLHQTADKYTLSLVDQCRISHAMAEIAKQIRKFK